MKTTKLVLGFAVTTLLLLSTGSAAHAQYEPGPSTTVVTSEIPEVTVVRGQTVEVSGARCRPFTEVVVTFDDGRVLTRLQADADGSYVATFTIPSDASVGRHLVTATCLADDGKAAKITLGSAEGTGVDADGYLRQYLYVNVLGDSVDSGVAGSGGNALPRTGSSNTAPLVGIGAGALVLGAAFVYGSRRPRTA